MAGLEGREGHGEVGLNAGAPHRAGVAFRAAGQVEGDGLAGGQIDIPDDLVGRCLSGSVKTGAEDGVHDIVGLF